MAINHIKIEEVDVFLDNIDHGRGKITISDSYNHNYSYFWGSMGSTLDEFICSIDSHYFAKNLIPADCQRVLDVRRTMASLRRYIREELSLNYYHHMEFQKDMRCVLSEFQSSLDDYPSEQYFVEGFSRMFIEKLDFYLIQDKCDRKEIKNAFEGMCEYWNLIEKKPSSEFVWLQQFQGKLKKYIKNHE